MGETVLADDGNMLPLLDLPMTFTYSGNNVISISVLYPFQPTTGAAIDKIYTQTFTYAGSNITNISRWIGVPA